MSVFSLLDWMWVILYLFIMIGAGILFYRFARSGEFDFFLAGRGVPWWLSAASDAHLSHAAGLLVQAGA